MNLVLQTKGKLSKEIEDKIEDVDILTDFDGTMIREESQYVEVLTYFFHKSNKIGFVKEVLKEYQNCKKKEDIKGFYSLFKGCPVETLDRLVKVINQNKKWDNLIESLKPKKIGIISRNSERFISKYLDELDYRPAEISLVAANIPEIAEEVYTGKVEMIVDNKNLIDFIGKKEYICDEEEREIIEKSENIRSERLKNGLYLCSRKKIF